VKCSPPMLAQRLSKPSERPAALDQQKSRARDQKGAFREDLYYRLKVVRTQTPPLREIADDIPIIAKHFLAKHCAFSIDP
jgi:DNA-binding NtrC family response regulator